MDHKIVAMRPEDYEEVYALWVSTPGVGLSQSDEKPSIESFLRQNPTLCYLSRRGASLTGTVLCGQDGRRGYIYHLVVHPGSRGQGVGKALVQKVLDSLALLGIQRCHLYAYLDNHAGRGFWKFLGWEERQDLIMYSSHVEPV